MAEYGLTIFSSPLGQTVLAFVLVFTVVFAILQKSEILGKGKRQVDALVALAVGLLVVSVGYALEIITRIIPFLGVSLVIILVFLILLGAFYKEQDFNLGKGVKVAFGIFLLIAVVIAVLYITNAWAGIFDFFSQSSSFIPNAILIIVIVGVALLAWFGAGKGSGIPSSSK